MTERLYRVAFIYDENVDYDEYNEYGGYDDELVRYEPEGWAEFSQEKWGEYKPFFWPSTRGIFRSRSAAQRRVDIIKRWGGNAEVLECTPQWQSVKSANRGRALARLKKRIEVIQEELDAQNAKLADLTKGETR
ncbi:hypothetical protein V8Z69_07565 [Microbacterium aurugineum]|uniref:hypothetical protein n=1 Tax=Microbacterium aurugineum TaxID=2851642 RepID=UPI0039BE6FCF